MPGIPIVDDVARVAILISVYGALAMAALLLFLVMRRDRKERASVAAAELTRVLTREPWFATARVPVQVAIETGPVPIEVTRPYRRAARGTLRISGTGVRLLAVTEAAGADEALFELDRETLTDPARVSFRGAAERAREVEHILTPLLHGWQNFGGFRIHGWVPAPGTPASSTAFYP